MILKLVHGKEIHVYDLKQGQSLTHLYKKIQQMFKNLPNPFVLTYKNNQQLQLQIDSDEQFDQLLNDLKPTSKSIKFYINADTSSDPKQELKVQSQENIPPVKQPYYDQTLTQTISLTQQLQQLPSNIINPDHPLQTQSHQSPSSINPTQEKEKQHQQLEKQFQPLNSSDQEDTQIKELDQQPLIQPLNCLNLSEDQGQRQLIETNLEQISDPREIDLLSSQQELKESLLPKLEQQQPQIKHQSQNPLSERPRKPIFEPVSYQVQQSQESIQKKIIQNEESHHHNATCNKCQCSPIIGIRYKCVVCPSYDLCSECEQSHSHQHPFLKICYPHQTPTHVQVTIPSFSQKKENRVQQIVLQRQDISKLNDQQRKQRFIEIASEISELLGVEIQQCLQFVRENEHYTKQTLIQLMIDFRHGNRPSLANQQQKKQLKKELALGMKGWIGDLKGLFRGAINL